MPSRVGFEMTDVKPSRRERAARTRQAIVRAATEEFRESGYHGATMAAIARRAEVAVQTVYFVFHAKPTLLTATIDSAVMGEDDPIPPDLTSWWQDATTTNDGRRAIGLFVQNVSVIEQRAAVLNRVARAAATTDLEVVDVLAHHEGMREEAFRRYVDTFIDRGLLRVGLAAAEATDVLLSLVGSDMFLVFTDDRGWPVERWVAWTTDTLAGLLLADQSANDG
jgi:AcrR family transcriptional regulator